MERIVDGPYDPQYDLHALVQLKFPATPAVGAAQNVSSALELRTR
jgi:hypothetical protein